MNPNDPQWPKTIHTTDISGLLVCERDTFDDPRGFFREVIEKRDLELVLGKKLDLVQWNHSVSLPQVIRGFHAEAWDKIVYVSRGNILAVIVDFRIDSPTFGKTLKFELGDNNRKALYLPEGMGNSYCNIGDTPADYMYLVTKYYEGKPTPAVSLTDPLLTKQFGGWPVANPIISEKDQQNPTLKEKFGTEVDLSKFPWLTEEN